MKPHTWVTEVIDGGPVGRDTFWKCQECGASGGPVGFGDPAKPPWKPFLAGLGKDLGALPEDCEESKRKIHKLRRLVEAQEECWEAEREAEKAVKKLRRARAKVARALYHAKNRL